MNKTTEGVTKQSGTNLLPLIVTSDINIQPAGQLNIIVITVKELGMRIRILIYGVRDRSGISNGKAWYK